MSESKKSRTVQEIHEEYSQLCARAGHLQYQVTIFQKDLELVNQQLKELNLEAASVQAAENKEKKGE